MKNVIFFRPVQDSWRKLGRRGWHFGIRLSLGNWEFSADNGSLQPWSHFKLHRREYETHIVAGRFSLTYGTPGLEPIRVCAECGEAVEQKSAGDEVWDVCPGCRQVEGLTQYVTLKEYEAR